MPKYKPQQQAAIDAVGKTIVSASAGSGKTTVMIEKIIGIILSGVEVERILAVTFTKKAAAQMKEKLREKLIEKINDKGTDRAQRDFLKAQLSFVATADICTIHSFCAKLLRQNFCEGEVSNTFSIVADNDADGKTLFAAALDEAFAEGYAAGDSDLMRLVSLYYKKKKDTALRQMLSSCYSALRSRDDYRAYLSSCGDDSKEKFDTICRRLLADLHARCDYYYAKFGEELAFFDMQKKCEQSKKVILAATEYLTDLLARKDYFDCVAIAERTFPSSQSVKTGVTPEEIALHIQRVKGLVLEVKEIQKTLLAVQAKEEEYARFASSMKTAKSLAKYLLLLDEKYAKIKAEKDVLDYADLEHFALKLLQKEEIQAELKDRYAYVFVDEYQDVNMVQEKLLSLVGGKDLFLVGDVKQAIYAFRGSRSELFIEKEASYKKEGHNALDLPHNFRSATDILDAVNAQFSTMMQEAEVGTDYVPMQTGGLYVDKDGKPAKGRVRVYFWKTDEKKEKEEIDGIYSVKTGKKKGKKRHSAQVKKVLDIIRREVKYGRWFDIKEADEDKRYKKVNYGDIAVLYRGMDTEVANLAAALAEEEIPTVGGETQNVCNFPEIRTLIDLLSLLDNERQDIPLCSALIAVQGLTNQDLASIRIAASSAERGRDESFYAACRRYEEKGGDALASKLTRFFLSLATMRLYAQVHTAGETINKLLTEYGLETKFLSRTSGGDCLVRIHRFVEEACTPEPMTVGEFLEKLKRLDYTITAPVSGGENAIKMMTIHASKGLEFPVVILMDLSKKLHAVGDGEVLISGDYGLLPFYYDEQTRRYHQTLARNLHVNEEGRGQVRDELNVYYVATTRAQYAMHMLFEERTLIPNPRFGDSYQAFTDFSRWDQYVYPDEDFSPVYETERTATNVDEDPSLVLAIKSSLAQGYAHADLDDIPVKDSATGLMRRRDGDFSCVVATDDADTGEEYEYEEEEAGVDKRLRGLAYHAFLEHFDFEQIGTGDMRTAVRDSIARFRRERTFEEGYFDYLDEGQLCKILSAPIFTRLKGCRLYKEQDFLVGLPVAEDLRLRGKDGDALEGDETEILYQGVIDLLAVGKEKTYIVDYKFSGRDAQYLRSHYAPQLALYKKAVSKITGRREEEIETVIVNIARAFEAAL